ncbi:MAG: hypothetical protein KF902_12850 [Phycisphaeraceae bacterium]|nr:hypothetical protein [Phycisphaeraceae bacterium]MCW5769092.1 hypothetical protein [Phycisphaeraceae bacterium]
MISTERQRMLLETVTARDEAHHFLRALEDAKVRSEKHLAEIGQPDHLKAVTGKSAMDNAIASTRRLIETYDRVLGELKANLCDEDLALLAAPTDASMHASARVTVTTA